MLGPEVVEAVGALRAEVAAYGEEAARCWVLPQAERAPLVKVRGDGGCKAGVLQLQLFLLLRFVAEPAALAARAGPSTPKIRLLHLLSSQGFDRLWETGCAALEAEHASLKEAEAENARVVNR